MMQFRIRTITAGLAACTLTLAPWTVPAWAEKRVAISIGIDAYDNLKSDQQLRKAVNDSRSIGDVLTSVGFEVIKGENLRRLEFNRLWQQFLNRIEPGDTVAVFFAGHGVEVTGSNFLLARDVPQLSSGEDEFLKGEAISLSKLVDDLRGRQPKVSVLILDACRNNPFAQSGGRSVGGSRGLARVEAPEGTFVMFSAGAGEAALDRLGDADGENNSVYTRQLLPLISKPGLTLPDLAQEVRRRVRELAASVRHRQTPAYYDEVVGRFCLAKCEGASQVALADPGVVIQPTAPRPLAIEAPKEAVPADLPVRPDVLRTIETHPFFADAPPVRAAAFNIVSAISSTTHGAGTMTSNYNDATNVRWLRQGLVRLDLQQNYTVNNSGATGKYAVQSSALSAANGSFNISYRMTAAGGGIRTVTTSQLIRIDNFKGRMFPVSVGNRFSYDSEYQWKSTSGGAGGSASTSTCEVTRKYDATSFHTNLTGAAYLLICDTQSTDRKDNSVTNSKSREFFFDALGIWLKVDPVLPRERIVSNNETSVNGAYTTVTNGTYTLRSFTLAR